MISAPIGLTVFSLSHTTLSWSHTQHLRTAGLDDWVQHLSDIHGRWLAAHMAGLALFPLLGMTVWWMLPTRGLAAGISKMALLVYMPLYVAVDAVLGIGSSVLISYREGLPLAERSGAEAALDALFFAPSVVDWLGSGASYGWQVGAIAGAIALWTREGWRVSLPLAAAGVVLARSHFPPEGAMAGVALALAVWQHLKAQPTSTGPSDVRL